jgi:VWFA-related protein
LLLPYSYSQKNPPIKVEVNVVSLDVTVLNPQGQAIDDLKQSDFLGKENNVPMEISNFSVAQDLSLSLAISLGTAFMPQKNLSLAKKTVIQLIHMLKPEDEICFYTFDQKDAYLEQDFTRSRSSIIRALENIGVAARSRRPGKFAGSFQTPPQVGLGLDIGMAAAQKGAYKRKALILIRDRAESFTPASLEHARQSNCALIALGFSEDRKNQLMLISDQSREKQLLLAPGTSQASDEKGDVTELCRTIVHLLLSRYNITYHTMFKGEKTARKIEVLAPGRNCKVLARRSNAPAQ